MNHGLRRIVFSIAGLFVLLSGISGLSAGWTSLNSDLLSDGVRTTDERPETTDEEADSERSNEPGQIDVRKSRAYTFVGKTGLGHDHGIEGKIKSGTIHLGAMESAGEIVFDMTSFDADTDAARRYVGLTGSTDASTRQQVNANMKGDPILNVRKYPTATFVVDSAKRLDKKSSRGFAMYELEGKFTLRGVTRPLKVQAELSEADGKDRLRGSFAILQTQFGITPFKKAFGAVGVANELRIHGDLYLTPAATSNR